MLIVYSNNHSEKTAQVKGAAKMMVTVVTTQNLEAGDVLRRFGPETAQDESRRGNNNNLCTVVCLVVVVLGNCRRPWDFFTCVLFFSSSFFIGACVCVACDDNYVYCVSLHV